MCGIAGIVSFVGGEPPNPDRLRSMSDSLAHRGPDQEGFRVRDGVGLAIRRLSIIDLETGDQPLYNEDRSVRVVFNGEIYNFRQLRQELTSAGHTFSTSTDGEVIAHLWEEHGERFASRLNGMFSIALHDHRSRRFVLVRDRVGIKPLFVARLPRHLIFASEIKAILASGMYPAELDLDGLAQFLSWEYIPAPGTMFRGIRKLEPGHLLVVDLTSGREESTCWWDIPAPAEPRSDRKTRGGEGSADEWVESIDAKIHECVDRQLVSDVPLGAFLSGGVDSSVVVSHMGDARAFSIGFEDPSYDESHWASRVATHLNLQHRLSVLQPKAGELFDHLMHFMEDPIADFSVFPTYLISKLASQEVTVVLAGDGGDELFAGYETFVAHRAARIWMLLPEFVRTRLMVPPIRRLPPRPAKKGWINKVKRFVEGAEHDPALRHARWRLFADDEALRNLLTAEALGSVGGSAGDHILGLLRRAGRRSELDRQLYVDFKSYLPDNCLVKVDRMTMACSLEARVPLLDHELVEMAFRVPAGLKLRGKESKVLLKRIAALHVPEECVYRPKEGFSMPVKSWLCDELRPLLEDLLAPSRVERQGIFQSHAVERLKREHLRGQANHSHTLWALMVFQDWTRRWGAA